MSESKPPPKTLTVVIRDSTPITHLDQPLRWKKPRTIFVNSMSDLFHEDITFEQIDLVFSVMALSPKHIFQVLTKRPDRMAEYLSDREDAIRETVAFKAPSFNGDASAIQMGGVWEDPQIDGYGRVELPGYFDDVQFDWPLPNVWLGVSVEDQATADERIPYLLQCPAAVRFLSMEPLLGCVDLEEIPSLDGRGETVLAPECWGDCKCDSVWGADDGCRRNGGDGTLLRRIDWVIAGGESGPNARPMHPDWVRGIRDQCVAAGVPFFFKQWGEWTPYSSCEDDGLGTNEDGELLPNWHFWGYTGGGPAGYESRSVLLSKREGKKLAGRELDGRTWDEFPGSVVGEVER